MPINLDRITHICMAINAVEGTHTTKRYIAQNEKVRATLYDILLTECDKEYDHGTPLKMLTAAIQKAGWDDQKVIRAKYALKIVEA
jgi:hypothetical protein